MVNQYRVRFEVHQGKDFNGNVFETTITVSARNMHIARDTAVEHIRKTYPTEIIGIIGDPVRVESMSDLKRESESHWTYKGDE